MELDPQRYAHYFTTPREMMSSVNTFLAFSFATRSIYQLLAVVTDMNLPNIPIEVSFFNPILCFEYHTTSNGRYFSFFVLIFIGE